MTKVTHVYGATLRGVQPLIYAHTEELALFCHDLFEEGDVATWARGLVEIYDWVEAQGLESLGELLWPETPLTAEQQKWLVEMGDNPKEWVRYRLRKILEGDPLAPQLGEPMIGEEAQCLAAWAALALEPAPNSA